MIDGKRLKQLREEHHYSAKKLGEILGYSEATVYRWEKENSLRDIDIVNKLAQIYGVTVSFILGKETTNEEVLKETAVTEEEPESEEIAPIKETAGTEEKAAKKQLSLVKIGAITAASTFTLFAIVTAIIILCVYFQPKTYDGATNKLTFSDGEVIILIGLLFASIFIITTATVLAVHFIRKRRTNK